MKIVMQALAVVVLLVGLLWIGQGMGVVKWPASSFMIDQRPWAIRGALLVVVGLILLGFSRRR